MTKTPILIIGYNRPEITSETLKMIARSSPLKVYFAIDGPKNEEDRYLVSRVSDIFHEGIKGASCVYYENETNLGPEITITNAITEVFKTEEQLIILEDDVLAPYSFLSFAEQMLIRYADDERVSMITGSNLAESSSLDGPDYFFAYLGNTLSGWATWKRAWEDFSLYEDFRISRSELKQRFRFKKMQSFFYANYHAFSLLPKGINTWDCCWQFGRIKRNKLSIVPRVNLTTNIGVIGTHFTEKSHIHNIPFDESFHVSPIKPEVTVNEAWDLAIYQHYLSSSFPGKILSWINLKIKVLRLLYDHWRHIQCT